LSNGTLLVNGALASTVMVAGGTLGGNGAIAGATVIRSGASLAPSVNGIGMLTFSNSLTLQAGSTNIFEISHSPLTNDVAKILGALTNGGTLLVTNPSGVALAVGDSFKLFSAASCNGAFAKVTLPALPASLKWNTNLLNTSGLISIVATTPPVFGSISVSGTNLAFIGTGGVANASFYLVGTTNLTTPLSNWTRLLTNQFDAGGNFNFTNRPNTNWPQGFYRLLVP
jgi:uncharacterized protein with beta-barrel porin domain